MYLSNLEFFRERDASLLVNFDYDRNLFKFEQNSALPVLKGRLKAKLDYWHTIGDNNFVIDTINVVIGFRSLVLLVRHIFLIISLPWIKRLLLSRLYPNYSVITQLLKCLSFLTLLTLSLCLYNHQARKRLFLTCIKSTSLFGSRSLSAKIGGFYYMLTSVITFLVLILSPVITILIFSQIIKLFWVFPGFSLVLSDIFFSSPIWS